MLPHEYPPWQTVYYHFRKWRMDGRLRRAHDRLREAVREAEKLAEADRLLVDVKKLQANTLSMLQEARNSGDLRTALVAVEKVRKNIELMLETEGRLDRSPTLNVHLDPEWIELKAVIVAALGRYPDARAAVVRAIDERSVRRALEAPS
jgi:hypothetical protein